MIIEIPGEPIAKMRHRYHLSGGKICSYDMQSELKEGTRLVMQSILRKSFDSCDKDVVMEASKISRSDIFDVSLTFHMPIPTTMSEANVNRLLWFSDCPKKPDIDNLVKFYLDCANGVLWQDDRQIVSLSSKKIYSKNPKTVIKITGRKAMKLHPFIDGILGIFGPEEFLQLVKDIGEGYADCIRLVEESVGEYQKDIRFISATAGGLFLSMIAEKYGDKLSKIKKKYPHIWKKWLEVSHEKKDFLWKTKEDVE